MNERLKIVITLFALAPFLIAGGGTNPPDRAYTMRAPVINAYVVVDPHEAGVTPTARRASVRLTRGALSASAHFNVPAIGFPFALGCDPNLTNARFVSAGGVGDAGANFVPLTNWMPEDVAVRLLQAVVPGQPLDTPGAINAIITSVDHVSCTPNNVTGTLTFHGRIHLIDF